MFYYLCYKYIDYNKFFENINVPPVKMFQIRCKIHLGLNIFKLILLFYTYQIIVLSM